MSKNKCEKYSLSYKYKGSKNVWTHTFESEKSMIEWKKIFSPFVKFKKSKCVKR